MKLLPPKEDTYMNKQSKVIWGVVVAVALVVLISIPFFYNNYNNKDTTPPDKTPTNDVYKDKNTSNDTNSPTDSTPTATVSFSQQDLNDEAILALTWLQNSGEYEALCYQAFNAARVSLDAILAKDSTSKKAIVLDVDETVLDNSAYNAGLIGTTEGYKDETWSKWVKAEKAKVIPGAVEFLTYADSKGISIYYITNRKEKNGLKEPTINNLKAYNFPQADEEHVMLRTDTSSKEERRNMVSKDKEIIMLVGDNLEDFDVLFDDKTNQKRREEVKNMMSEFGKKFIVLPNPVYGSWEGSLAEGYFGLTPEEKSLSRIKTLNAWAQ